MSTIANGYQPSLTNANHRQRIPTIANGYQPSPTDTNHRQRNKGNSASRKFFNMLIFCYTYTYLKQLPKLKELAQWF
jgi:hypothetical protein